MTEQRKDTMYNFLAAFNDFEQGLLVECLNKHAGGGFHLGKLPFVARTEALAALDREADLTFEPEGDTTLRRMIKKIDIEEVWVDVTTIVDTHRKLVHSITGEIRFEEPMGVIDKDDYFSPRRR